MNNYELTCTYCDHKWESNYLDKDKLRCIRCGDRFIMVINIAKDKIDYYQGSPPFPTTKDDGWTW